MNSAIRSGLTSLEMEITAATSTPGGSGTSSTTNSYAISFSTSSTEQCSNLMSTFHCCRHHRFVQVRRKFRSRPRFSYSAFQCFLVLGRPEVRGRVELGPKSLAAWAEASPPVTRCQCVPVSPDFRRAGNSCLGPKWTVHKKWNVRITQASYKINTLQAMNRPLITKTLRHPILACFPNSSWTTLAGWPTCEPTTLPTEHAIVPIFQAYVSLKHNGDKVVVFERANLLFVFNFHEPTFYRPPTDHIPATYRPHYRPYADRIPMTCRPHTDTFTDHIPTISTCLLLLTWTCYRSYFPRHTLARSIMETKWLFSNE